MNGFDLSTISNVYIGSTPGSAIYLGNTKIWPKHDYSLDYFTIEAIDAGTLGFPYTASLSVPVVYYSLDGSQTWSLYDHGQQISLNAGDKVLLKSTAYPVYATRDIKINYVSWDYDPVNGHGRFNVEGNIHSLIYGDNFIGTTSFPVDFSDFMELFADQNVIDASNLILPATTLSYNCYYLMFYDCKSLVSAPSLQATTLTSGCYGFMFNNCTALTTSPVLPATTLVSRCYEGMFKQCTSLNYVKCLATDISAMDCTKNWLTNVASSGTFVKNTSMNSWTTGYDGIPTNWTVQNAS